MVRKRERPVARWELERDGAAATRRVAPRDLAGPGPGRGQGLAPPTQPPCPSGTATRASAGAVSSAKPPPPQGHRRARPTWGAPPSSAGPRAPRRRGRAAAGPVPEAARRAVAGAADTVRARGAASTMVRQPVQRHRWASRAALDVVVAGVGPARLEGGQPHDDPRGAEAALAGARRGEGLGPPGAHVAGRARRGWSPPRPATRRAGVTQATRGAPSTHTVQHPHWPWGLQPSLARPAARGARAAPRGATRRRRGPRPRRRRRGSESVGAGAGAGAVGQLNDEPQPQVRVAFGLEMWNPAPWRPSV